MRVLLYGMQSSGATVQAFTLAQKADSLAFLDIWNMFAAPRLETGRDCVAKAVATAAFSLEVHRRRFRPDVTLLVLRHPVDTYDSLSGQTYANESGLIEDKFSVMEGVFRAGVGFDHIVYFEDFVFSPGSLIELCNRIGWRLDYEALLFGRTQRQIEEANAAAFPDLQGRLRYGGGNLKLSGHRRQSVRFSAPSGESAHLPLLCPSLFDHYAALRTDRGALWHVPSAALLSCGLGAILRELAMPGAIPKQSAKAGYSLRLINGTPRCLAAVTALSLSPSARGRETRLTVSGLPGRPFNRIRGTAYAAHPGALGTDTRIRIESSDGECLAQQEFTLRHCDTRVIDLAFEPRVSTVALNLGVRLAEGAAADAAVCFQELRLEQVAT